MSGRVLLVTDDANAQRAFREAFAPVRSDWEVAVARGGPEAMRRLEGPGYDAPDAGAQLAGVGCAERLLETRRRHLGA